MQKILIIDINHGALDLAQEYVKLSSNYGSEYYDIHVWDIYGKLEKDRALLKKYSDTIGNIKIIKKVKKYKFEFEQNEFEKIIAPIHCPIDCNFISFHDAVSDLIHQKYGDVYKKFIEITGVKGKTTTSELVKHILSDEFNIYINNSNMGSITPVAILNSMNDVYKSGKLDFYDFYIFEVSLGVTQCMNGAVTNVLENYSIGKGRRDALTAKISSLKNAKYKHINKSTIDKYINVECVKELLNYDNVNIIDMGQAKVLNKYPLKYKYKEYIVEFSSRVFGMHNIENSLFAINLCKKYMDVDSIIEKIKTFEIKNRMDIQLVNNKYNRLNKLNKLDKLDKNNKKYIINNINPGLDVKSIENSIEDFISTFSNGTIIIGGEFGCTCEELDIKKLSNVIKKYIITNKHDNTTSDSKYHNKYNNIKFLLVGDVGKELLKYYKDYKNYNIKYIKCLPNKYDDIDDSVLVIYRKSIGKSNKIIN